MASAEANPAFQLVAGATGLLVFLLILNQLILFGAALTATDTRGRVRGLATGQRLPTDEARPLRHRRRGLTSNRPTWKAPASRTAILFSGSPLG